MWGNKLIELIDDRINCSYPADALKKTYQSLASWMLTLDTAMMHKTGKRPENSDDAVWNEIRDPAYKAKVWQRCSGETACYYTYLLVKDKPQWHTLVSG